jgi:exopolysaccharide biosynthesis polyprenyl glycosylphosphotransferase
MSNLPNSSSTRGSAYRMLDLVALLAAFPLAYETYVRIQSRGGCLPSTDSMLLTMAVAVAAWIAFAGVHQLYTASIGRSRLGELARLAKTLAGVAVVVAAVGFFARQKELSRLLLALYFVLVLALTLVVRLVPRLVATATHGGESARRYAVIGTGGMAREIIETVDAHPEWGLRFAGFVLLDGANAGSRGPCLGAVANLGRILEDAVIDVVVIAAPRRRLAEVERAVHVCEEQGVEVCVSLDILHFGPGRMAVSEMDGLQMLSFTRAPTDALALVAKRVFDVVMSGLVLVALAPLLAAVAAAIRLDSPGPIFFRQRRVGQNGRVFEMLKFRSMYRDAEARLELLRSQNEMSGPVFKMANDPRVTRVGRFLRRTSLDEFPQFWNVLEGNMSIVGPRPPIPSEVRQYKRWQRRRLSMKPGITCIWQISGRNNVDFDRWMELDLQYIDEWSLWGDIRICFRTIPAVLSARGAR